MYFCAFVIISLILWNMDEGANYKSVKEQLVSTLLSVKTKQNNW